MKSLIVTETVTDAVPRRTTGINVCVGDKNETQLGLWRGKDGLLHHVTAVPYDNEIWQEVDLIANDYELDEQEMLAQMKDALGL